MKVPRDDHTISPPGVEYSLRTRLTNKIGGRVQSEGRDWESVFWVGEGMRALIVGNGDRFEWDEQREYRPQATDAERRELQPRDGSSLRWRNYIGYSTTCWDDHWVVVGDPCYSALQRRRRSGTSFRLEPTIICHHGQ